jgi:dihydrofolate synthase / folylpolyglutamate synthase
MQQLRSLEEVTEIFLAYSPPDMRGKYQLDRIKKLMAFLGDPQEKFKAIHIAGTSGKTSTAYFIRGLLEASGKRTGLTVSPHIVAVNERVQIGGVPLEESEFLAYVNRFLSLIEPIDLQPTYFELLIALAYWVFAEEKVDYAIIETGLGGLLDGTNTISRADKVCVITDIGFDHTEILGETLPEIAAQKAGIIHPHNTVIVRQQGDSVMRVISETVHKKQASLFVVDSYEAPDFLPDFQHRNWALAKAAFDYIGMRDGLPGLEHHQFVEAARHTPPGRWEVYYYKDKTIILDGAHNPQKIQALCGSLRLAGITKCAVLANFSEAPIPKVRGALETLKPFTTHLIIPEFRAGQDLKSRRSFPADRLAQYAQTLGYPTASQQPDLSGALAMLLGRPEKTLLITGSLYLVSAARPVLIYMTHITT